MISSFLTGYEHVFFVDWHGLAVILKLPTGLKFRSQIRRLETPLRLGQHSQTEAQVHLSSLDAVQNWLFLFFFPTFLQLGLLGHDLGQKSCENIFCICMSRTCLWKLFGKVSGQRCVRVSLHSTLPGPSCTGRCSSHQHSSPATIQEPNMIMIND